MMLSYMLTCIACVITGPILFKESGGAQSVPEQSTKSSHLSPRSMNPVPLDSVVVTSVNDVSRHDSSVWEKRFSQFDESDDADEEFSYNKKSSEHKPTNQFFTEQLEVLEVSRRVGTESRDSRDLRISRDGYNYERNDSYLDVRIGYQAVDSDLTEHVTEDTSAEVAEGETLDLVLKEVKVGETLDLELKDVKVGETLDSELKEVKTSKIRRRVPDEQKLYRRLLFNYEPSVRPVINSSQPVVVRFQLTLHQIVDLDERKQFLTSDVFINQEWTDENLRWNREEYNGVQTLRVRASYVWLPDTFMLNNAEDGATGYFQGIYVLLSSTGVVRWPVPVRLRSSCNVDIKYFPFDDQICTLKFGSWIYSGDLVEFQGSLKSLDRATYIDNSEWSLVSVSFNNTTRSHIGLGQLSTQYPDLHYIIHMRRRTFYYVFNIIVPCVMLSILTLLTFWLPPTSGEKISLGLSVFLTFSMFMLLIAEEVPATSESVPLIGIYMITVMTMTSLSVILAVLVISCYSRGEKARPPPAWLSHFILHWVAGLVHLTHDVDLLAANYRLPDEDELRYVCDIHREQSLSTRPPTPRPSRRDRSLSAIQPFLSDSQSDLLCPVRPPDTSRSRDVIRGGGGSADNLTTNWFKPVSNQSFLSVPVWKAHCVSDSEIGRAGLSDTNGSGRDGSGTGGDDPCTWMSRTVSSDPEQAACSDYFVTRVHSEESPATDEVTRAARETRERGDRTSLISATETRDKVKPVRRERQSDYNRESAAANYSHDATLKCGGACSWRYGDDTNDTNDNDDDENDDNMNFVDAGFNYVRVEKADSSRGLEAGADSADINHGHDDDDDDDDNDDDDDDDDDEETDDEVDSDFDEPIWIARRLEESFETRLGKHRSSQTPLQWDQERAVCETSFMGSVSSASVDDLRNGARRGNPRSVPTSLRRGAVEQVPVIPTEDIVKSSFKNKSLVGSRVNGEIMRVKGKCKQNEIEMFEMSCIIPPPPYSQCSKSHKTDRDVQESSGLKSCDVEEAESNQIGVDHPVINPLAVNPVVANHSVSNHPVINNPLNNFAMVNHFPSDSADYSSLLGPAVHSVHGLHGEDSNSIVSSSLQDRIEVNTAAPEHRATRAPEHRATSGHMFIKFRSIKPTTNTSMTRSSMALFIDSEPKLNVSDFESTVGATSSRIPQAGPGSPLGQSTNRGSYGGPGSGLGQPSRALGLRQTDVTHSSTSVDGGDTAERGQGAMSQLISRSDESLPSTGSNPNNPSLLITPDIDISLTGGWSNTVNHQLRRRSRFLATPLGEDLSREDDPRALAARRQSAQMALRGTGLICSKTLALKQRRHVMVTWQIMATIIDRLLFWFFLLGTILVYLVVLVMMPLRKPNISSLGHQDHSAPD